MFDALENVIRDLENDRAGWVTRRDAAQTLGEAARRAMAALEAQQHDSDTDVRNAVQEQLARVNTTARPTIVVRPAYSLAQLAKACESPGRRVVSPQRDGYTVRVELPGRRSQNVHLMPHIRGDGQKLFRVYSVCGPADANALAWALRSNTQLTHCAYAIHNEGGKESLILVNNFKQESASPEAVKEAVKEIAFYADWLENKLSGLDEF